MKLLFLLMIFIISPLSFSGPTNLFPPKPVDEWKDTFIITMRHGTRLDGVFALPDEAAEATYDDWVEHATKNNFEPWNSPLAPKEHQDYLQESIRQILAEGLFPEIIITSPYTRAVETARMVRDALIKAGHPVKMLGDKDLQEWPYAAFGRLGNPIPENFIWSTPGLEDELTLESESSHVSRIAAVLRLHAATRERVLIVGHQHTVGAMFPFAHQFAKVTAGGYAFGVYDKKINMIIPDISRSRGLVFHPGEPQTNSSATAEQQ